MNNPSLPEGGNLARGDESDSFLAGSTTYAVGLILALALTAAAFWVAHSRVLWGPGIPVGLAVLAVAQMGVHLVFFLHITTGPDDANNILALVFGIVIVFLVVVGSLWIMANLNPMIVPMSKVMNMQP